MKGELKQKDLSTNADEDTDNRTVISADQRYSYVSQTMFYQPDAEMPIKLSVNSKEVKLNKEIGTGKELAQKLVKRGWLKSTKKYYIVTQPEQAKNTIGDIRDSFTVALVLEDDEKCYVTTLRALGRTKSKVADSNDIVIVDEEREQRERMLMQGANWRKIAGNKPIETHKQKITLYNKVIFDKSYQLAKSWYFSQHGTEKGFDKWYKNDPNRADYVKESDFQAALGERRRQRGYFIEKARLFYAKPGNQILSQAKIDQEIKDLREFRNKIIDEYLTKIEKDGKTVYQFPVKPKTTVVPEKVMQSNGTIKTEKDGVNPIYKSLFKEETTIDEITEQLESGKVKLAVGLGAFGRPAFGVRGLMDINSTTEYTGKGLSGKIFLLVDPLAEFTENHIPIMLHEERFDTQTRTVNGTQQVVYLNDKKNIKLCLKYDAENKQWINANKDGYAPSIAEIILHVVAQNLFSGITVEAAEEGSEFIVHNGEKTLLQNQPNTTGNLLNVFGAKQLAFTPNESGVNTLKIGLKGADGVFRVEEFEYDDLFAETEVAHENKLRVVHAIAT